MKRSSHGGTPPVTRRVRWAVLPTVLSRLGEGLLLHPLRLMWAPRTVALAVSILAESGAGCTQKDATAPAPSARSGTFAEIFSLKGRGNTNTESFRTSGGRLKVLAKTSGSRVGSYSSIELSSEDKSYLSNASLSIGTSGSEIGNGETIIRDAKAGTYFIQVISGVDWEVHVYEEK